MGNLSFLRFPTAGTETFVVFILFVLSFILFIILVGLIRGYLREKHLKDSFFKEALEKGLSEEEALILWTYSRKLGRDPFLTLEFKAPFEKVVDLYLNSESGANEDLVQDMRAKLGFDYVPYFVPLTSTKDIELFQTAKLYLPDKTKHEVALFDKDERYMYWALVENVPGINLSNTKVTISFIRRGDGIYTFEAPVEDTYVDNGKFILQLPHTFELTRYQRREFARVEVELPVSVGIFNRKENKINWVKGEIVDISAGGAKVCIPLSELNIELSPTMDLILSFDLAGRRFRVKSTIVNVYPRKHTNCYGVKFESLKPEEQKYIHDFVKKEQQRLAQLYLKNKG